MDEMTKPAGTPRISEAPPSANCRNSITLERELSAARAEIARLTSAALRLVEAWRQEEVCYRPPKLSLTEMERQGDAACIEIETIK